MVKESVTRNAKKPKVKTGTKRQQDLRARRKKEGKKTVSAVLDPAVFAKFENSRAVRGGIDGPYDADAYIVALVREDAARLEGQIADAQRYPCRQCGKTLPGGCGGAFKGELACLHTPTAWKLQIPTVDV